MWTRVCHFSSNNVVMWLWCSCGTLVFQHLAIVVVDKNVAGAVVSEVRDLQAVGVSNFLWLEGCIDGIHFNHGFWFLCLQLEH